MSENKYAFSEEQMLEDSTEDPGFELNSRQKAIVRLFDKLEDRFSNSQKINHDDFIKIIKSKISSEFELKFFISSDIRWCRIDIFKGKHYKDDKYLVSKNILSKYSVIKNGEVWYLTF